jgi:hypothetical protein
MAVPIWNIWKNGLNNLERNKIMDYYVIGYSYLIIAIVVIITYIMDTFKHRKK